MFDVAPANLVTLIKTPEDALGISLHLKWVLIVLCEFKNYHFTIVSATFLILLVWCQDIIKVHHHLGIDLNNYTCLPCMIETDINLA